MKINYINASRQIYQSNISLLDVRFGSPPTEEQKRLHQLQEEIEKNSSHFDCGNHYDRLCRCDYPDYRVYSIINQSFYYL